MMLYVAKSYITYPLHALWLMVLCVVDGSALIAFMENWMES